MSGRTKLREDMIEKAYELVKAGNHYRVISQYFGIDESTWHRWMRKGELAKNKNSIYYRFYKAVRKAEAEAHARNVEIIQQAAKTQWQAAAWWLERRYPEIWGRRDRIGIGLDGEKGIKIEIVPVSASEPKEAADDESKED